MSLTKQRQIMGNPWRVLAWAIGVGFVLELVEHILLDPLTDVWIHQPYVQGALDGLLLAVVLSAALYYVHYVPTRARLVHWQAESEEYAYMLSHDLRTPLTPIQGYAQMLEQRLTHKREDMGREAHMAHVIAENVARLNGMIGTLTQLTYMELGKLNVEHVDVGHIAEDCVRAVGDERVTCACAYPLPPVYGDPAQLERVVLNLLSNALKYSSGPVAVTVRAQAKGRGVLLLVQDHGPGIPAKDLPHIWRKRYRAVGSVEGMGLGLYIVKSIVETHGGTVGCGSTPGVGSTFVVKLPAGRV